MSELIERLRAALEPFAREYREAGADHLPAEQRWVDANGDVAGDPVVCSGLTVGDFRRARTAYATAKGADHAG